MNGYISKERAEICVMSAIEGSEDEGVLRALDDVRLAINSEPAANVAPVVCGEWCGSVCSACGESTSFWYNCNYCPHCGAEMSEREESGNE